ncbi:MAG: hypothetical protein AAF958_04300 [Planctomycetota bacterium]
MCRILIGTLYCGENEFERCCEAIENQTHRRHEQFVIRDLPNKQAHQTLYRTFMDRADDFDMFVKVDADMILFSKQKLADLVRYFARHDYLDGISIPVLDGLTDRWIHGLHAYRSSVRWPQETDENVFVDRVPVAPERFRLGVRELAPFATHCEDPADTAAIHFGLHRGKKVLAALERDGPDSSNAAYYLDTLHAAEKTFRRRNRRASVLAVLGGELALTEHGDSLHVDYSHTHTQAELESWAAKPTADIWNEVQRLQSVSSIDPVTRRRLLRMQRRRRFSDMLRETFHDQPLRFASNLKRKLRKG